VVLDAHALRHGRRPDILTRLRRLHTGESDRVSSVVFSAHDAPADDEAQSSVVAPIERRGSAEARQSGSDHPSRICRERECELEQCLRETGSGLRSESQRADPRTS
jgi:hypothetical protein